MNNSCLFLVIKYFEKNTVDSPDRTADNISTGTRERIIPSTTTKIQERTTATIHPYFIPDFAASASATSKPMFSSLLFFKISSLVILFSLPSFVVNNHIYAKKTCQHFHFRLADFFNSAIIPDKRITLRHKSMVGIRAIRNKSGIISGRIPFREVYSYIDSESAITSSESKHLAFPEFSRESLKPFQLNNA